MRLSDLVKRDMSFDPQIEGVTADSRKVRPGWLFAALPGAKVDGRSFAPRAVEQGAVAVLTSREIEGLSAATIIASDPRRVYALAAAAFWGQQPATCVAVTGTNGKTSVAGFCRQMFANAGFKAASMGTLGVRVSAPGAADEQVTPPGLTTPDASDVAELMARVAQSGVTHLALEASSHGIDQRRLDGVKLTAAGFLNLTQDHLDYHGTMGVYRAAKLRLFETLLARGGTAVLNADSDAYSAFAATAVGAGQTLMSVGAAGQGLKLLERALLPDGQALKIAYDGRTYDLRLPLAGAFQASNALVATGLCVAGGLTIEQALAGIEKIEGAPGRLQRVGQGPRGGEAYVDYAHTPDGLETVLNALRPHVRGKLIVVFGAGGDRDRTKRPLMGRIAADLADVAIVTDDNPRSENPAAIRAEILTGARGAKEIGDRREAIRAAAALLGDGDILVIAGKGHEQGQIVGDVVHPFDDVSETAQALGGAPSMAEPLWTSAEIEAATGGKLSGGAFAANGVSIDTRTLEPGDLFVALGGVRDGHGFVDQARDRGAAGALAFQPVSGPAVMVEDTLRGLERLGEAARDRAPAVKRGAVTGSVGKTSVTQAIMAGLMLAGRAHSSIKSYNNHIGVPLTLARMPRDTERAVFEIGMNHAEEIRPLTRMVRPHAAVVTTVGPVHTENFPDGEAGVAKAKAEVFEGLQTGGVAVLNADNHWFDLLQAEAKAAGAEVRTFGRAEGCDARLIDFQGPSLGGADHAVVQARFHGKGLDFPILQTGLHWGLNAMAVLLMLEALDVDLGDSLAALGSFEPLDGRGAEKTVRLARGAFTLIDESYNANPVSMASAIATLGARRGPGRKVVALTDMLELGSGARGYHAALAQPLADAGVDLVFAAGPLMKSLWDALPPTRRGGYAEQAADLAEDVARAAEPGDVVMVKGSNGSKAGVIAQALARLDVRPREAG